MTACIITASVLILAALLIGFSLGVGKGRGDVIKALNVPKGYTISGISYRKID